MRPLKIILLSSAFNGLTQQAWLEWLRIGLVGLRWSVDLAVSAFPLTLALSPRERGLKEGYWRFTQT